MSRRSEDGSATRMVRIQYYRVTPEGLDMARYRQAERRRREQIRAYRKRLWVNPDEVL